MFRRMIVLACVGLAVAASPAFADCHWQSQMKHGTATASRALGRCSVRAGSLAGSLRITCPPGRSASLTYLFAGTHDVRGTPAAGIDVSGTARLQSKVTVESSSIRITLTVSGAGVKQVNSVSVAYYSH
jgi:hypothetical protein